MVQDVFNECHEQIMQAEVVFEDDSRTYHMQDRKICNNGYKVQKQIKKV